MAFLDYDGLEYFKGKIEDEIPSVDATLSVAGAAADAGAVGAALSARDKIILLDNSINLLRGLNTEGRTHQGITWTRNADGSLTVSGTSTAQSFYYAYDKGPLPYGMVAGKTYLAKYPSNISAMGIAFWDSEDESIGDAITVMGVTRFTIPSNATKIRFRCTVTSGKTINETIPIGVYAARSNVDLATGSYLLAGKKIVCDGASIMSGGASYAGGYIGMISEQNGMLMQNYAVGGATIAKETYTSGGGARHWICSSLKTLPTGRDFVVFDGAFNDMANDVEFGTPASVTNYSPTLDETTFSGAFESCCMTLVNRFTTSKKGYVFPNRKTNGDWWRNTWKPFIIQTLEKWGIPYLDLEKAAPPIGVVDSLKTAYTVNGEGLHPTEECYRLFYVDPVKAWLLTL